MKDFKFVLAAALLAATSVSVLHASSMVFIYENEAAVTAGKSVPAPEMESGAVIPATTAIAQGNTLLIGDAEGLTHAVLFRLDNDLNVAVVRRGEAVKDAQIVGRHLHQWAASSAFLSLSNSGAPAAAEKPVVAASSQPFRATINGVGEDSTVVLKSRFNKARFTLQVVNTSTSPVWSMSVRLSSDPKLSFWKEGRRTGLNEVPEPVLSFDRQAILKPIAPGESISISAEAYYMKGKDYTWTAKTTAKGLSGETKLAVRID